MSLLPQIVVIWTARSKQIGFTLEQSSKDQQFAISCFFQTHLSHWQHLLAMIPICLISSGNKQLQKDRFIILAYDGIR